MNSNFIFKFKLEILRKKIIRKKIRKLSSPEVDCSFYNSKSIAYIWRSDLYYCVSLFNLPIKSRLC